MAEQTAAERQLAELIVSNLNLEDVDAAQIDPQAALFGDELGLDSIDALEIALAVRQQYGVQLQSGSDNNKRIFSSLRALNDYIEQHRAAD